MKRNLFLSLLMFAAMAVSAKDIRKVTVTTTPQMH